MKTQLLNNRYEILHTIGRGGFGETFLAIDTHMPSARKCVIKQLKPLLPVEDNWVKERFQREAAILEDLGEHNNQIPRLFAYFSEGNNFYLVQEWIQGLTLQQLCQKEGVFNDIKVRSILTSLLPVLSYIHEKRIVHRDIKPENIIIRSSDNLPVLIDFGAVKETMATVVATSGNPFSVGIGTPGYMPSEQAAGRPIYSSDLYSLGLSALFVLTGKSPQELETDPKTGEFILPQSLQNFDPNLVATIRKAIRFHPRDRFSTATEMLQALNFNSVVKTVAVSPSRSHHKTKIVTPTPQEYSEEVDNQYNWLVILFLIFGILFGSIAGISFVLNKNQSPVTPVTPSENPIPTLPETVFNEETSPPPEETTPPPEETTPPPEETTPPPEETTPLPEETTPPPEETTPPPEETTPPPEEITPPPEETTPPPEETSPPPKTNSVSQVPIITIGTSKNTIIKTLGQPTSLSKGYWANSQAILYQDYLPGQLDLGYLVDTTTQKLRQTEASFSSNTDINVLENTLTGLLQGNISPNIKSDLIAVYNRQTDLRSFSISNFKGMIQRNSSDRIYISIWDQDFH